MSSTTVVGFVGLGSMGWPMAARLAAAGHPVRVHDVRPGIGERFVAEHGGVAPATLAEVAESSDVVITMVPNGAIVRAVVVGDGGDCLLTGMRAGSVLVDMSSSEPSGTQELGKLLADRRVSMLDAPVSGGVARAVTGELSVLVGGDDGVFEACRAVLAQLGTGFFHTGPLGTGHAMKALNNLLSAAGLVAATEAMLIGARFGLQPSTMLDALNASTGRNNSTERKFGPFVMSGAYDSGFALDLMVKDLGIALGIARDTDTPSPVSDEVMARCVAAQRALGAGADHTAVAKWLQDVVGTRLDGGS